MTALDRQAARALTEAGYMPLGDYIAAFGHDKITLVPEIADDPHDAFSIADRVLLEDASATRTLAQKIRLAWSIAL